jgi:transcriptional regulator with XRE-family HTH domain
MSTEVLPDSLLPEGTPELTPLGKRLEILRIERGISKQHLARHAGTSRQQLWRVMTGKSELTSSLRERLAFALAVEPLALYDRHRSTKDQAAQSDQLDLTELAVVPTLHDYLTEPARLSATLRTLPSGNGGRRLKRALLNAVEDLAVEAGQALPLDYSDIRRRVLAGGL